MKHPHASRNSLPPALPPSAALYGRTILSVYDAYVLGFSNAFVWRCPTRRILDLYDRWVSPRHLEVGVGTGYFLDHCRFPVARPSLVLLDVNPNSLEASVRRLRRYRPQTCLADVTQPLPLPESGFSSIGVNYLLHCLPGSLAEKGPRVFGHLLPLLARESGVIFGSTILGRGVRHNLLGRRLMALYNGRGVFGNRGDSEDDLRQVLAAHFPSYTLEVQGCVAMFAGRAQSRFAATFGPPGSG
ncbi:MAG: class I SAM-dependent methyltransferase [Pseudomonadota bacterium]|jgi:hypothetical protein